MKNLLDTIQDQELKELLLKVTSAANNLNISIGIMGKSGAGKSSIINALCRENVCKAGAVGGCTREIQRISAKLGNMKVTLVDFPGIAENQQWDKTYIDLYKKHLNELDLILWVIKIDDRAILEDEKFFNELLRSQHSIKSKIRFILSQADKTEPMREWNYNSYQPSKKQLENIKRNRQRICEEFDFSIDGLKIIPISTNYSNNRFQHYNFDEIFDMILFDLKEKPDISDKLSFGDWRKCSSREWQKISEMTKYHMEYQQEQVTNALMELEELLEQLEK